MRVVVCLKFIKFHLGFVFFTYGFSGIGRSFCCFLCVTDLIDVLNQSMQFARESSYLERQVWQRYFEKRGWPGSKRNHENAVIVCSDVYRGRMRYSNQSSLDSCAVAGRMLFGR